MDQQDVERIIRGVLTDLGGPLPLLEVERTAQGWHAMVKQTARKRVVSVRVPDGPPSAIRTAVMYMVEAELDEEV